MQYNTTREAIEFKACYSKTNGWEVRIITKDGNSVFCLFKDQVTVNSVWWMYYSIDERDILIKMALVMQREALTFTFERNPYGKIN